MFNLLLINIKVELFFELMCCTTNPRVKQHLMTELNRQNEASSELKHLRIVTPC